MTSSTAFEIRPDIADSHAGLFGSKAVNGRTVDVVDLIASLTRTLSPEFDKILAARRTFLESVASGNSRPSEATCGSTTSLI